MQKELDQESVAKVTKHQTSVKRAPDINGARDRSPLLQRRRGRLHNHFAREPRINLGDKYELLFERLTPGTLANASLKRRKSRLKT
jgi:hypothetical protein